MKIFWIFLLFLTACSSSDTPSESTLKRQNQKGEYIYRVHNEKLFETPPPTWQKREPYPWEIGVVANLPRITKEFFRCKGSSLNPEHAIQTDDDVVRFKDCGGISTHGLPIKDDKEFIYPILIELLNYLQAETKKRVIITSGHRCPKHNTYVDPSRENRTSKHQVGAEVAFYIQDMENEPETIVHLLQNFYQNDPELLEDSDYSVFRRYTKQDTNVSIEPWYNKEIFIKLFKKGEGRNLDNRHPYPYISIQVRHDRDRKTRVFYNWDDAYKRYLRK